MRKFLVDTIRLRVHGANQHKQGIINKMISENTKTSLHLVPEHNELFMSLHNIKKTGFTFTKVMSKEYEINSTEDINDIVSCKTSAQKNHFFSHNTVKFQSDEFVKERTANLYGKYRVRSSESEVTYSLNYEGGFMDFEFSIPKYLYGHNLAQFLPQCDSKVFYKNKERIENWNSQKHLLFKRLEKFIYLFLQDLFFNCELPYSPNMNYVELVRLDLCYNQYFENKEISLAYLEEIKKLRKNTKIYSPDTNTDFKTTVAWRTQNGNYFKIYHKGSEYINQKFGDFKKHTKINENFLDNYFKFKKEKKIDDLEELEKEISKNDLQKFRDEIYKKQLNDAFYIGLSKDEIVKKERLEYKKFRDKINNLIKKSVNGDTFHISEIELKAMKNILLKSEDLQLIDTKFLKDEMDKILRYEVSMSGKYLSYQFKNYVFRVNCPIHKEAKRIYKKVKRQLESGERLSVKIPPYHMALYKMMHRFLSTSNSIVMSKNPLLKTHSTRATYDFNKLNNNYKISKAYVELGMGSLLEKTSTGIWSQTFLIHLVDNFKKLINDFQVQEIEPFDTLEKRVIRFNEEVEKNKLKYDYLHQEIRKIETFLLSPLHLKRYEKLLIKKNPDYIKRSDLLTEKEKQDKGLQKISYADMIQLFTLMHDEKLSAFQIQQKLNLSKGQYYRRKKNLKILGISENHVSMIIPIKPKIDFYTYYFKTSGMNYKNKFFLKPVHSTFS